MPRQPRIDIPGLLQHVMVRGIEGSDIFRDDDDRRNFLQRLSALLVKTGTDCFAWALIPNHFHLLLRCSSYDLSRFMRSLLTGYAVTFNRRHSRSGHLFQNRYKSVVCEEDSYLLELIRYIHLNPLRAGLTKNLDELALYPWSGHGVLLGNSVLDGQPTDEILSHFGKKTGTARAAYRTFVADGVSMGKRPELTGGGLKRSQLKDEKENGIGEYDERILGSGEFVASLRQEPKLSNRFSPAMGLGRLRQEVSAYYGIPAESLGQRGRQNRNSQARELFCYLATRELGCSGTEAGSILRMGSPSVTRAARRGEEQFGGEGEIRRWWLDLLKH